MIPLNLEFGQATDKSVGPKWKTFKINDFYDFQTLKLQNGETVRLSGIDMPHFYQPEYKSHCLHKNIKYFYQVHLVNQSVKIRGIKTNFWYQRGIKNVEIRFSDSNEPLNDIFIDKGWGKMSAFNTNKALKKQQIQAQKNRLGRWGQCDTQTQWRYGDITSNPPLPASTRRQTEKFWMGQAAKVTDVSPDLDIHLSNGLKVRLLGLKFPNTTSNPELSQCFVARVQKALKDELQFKTVIATRDPLFQRTDAYLYRVIDIPKTRYESEINVNAWLLKNGFGQLQPAHNALPEFMQSLEQAEKEGLAKPKGAYEECFLKYWKPPALTSEEKIEAAVEVVEIITPEIIYDETCRIKGNISGTKKKPIKKYHTPLSGWYKRLKPEQCFVDEAEAESAGFIKVK